MPKQFYKLNDFTGGLNLIRDARDISPTELKQADNLSLRVAGSVSTANSIQTGTGGDNPSGTGYIFPGGGRYYFETDRLGGAAAKDSGERWTAGLDSRTGVLALDGKGTGAISSAADLGTITSFTFAANTLEFSGTSIQARVAGDIDFSDYFQEGDVIRITGCTDATANNRICRVSNFSFQGGSATSDYMNTGTNWTSEGSEAGTVLMEKIAEGVFFASDDMLRVADGRGNPGLKRKQYGYIKQIHFEDGGVAKDSYDNWFANDCDLSPPTALLIHGSSYPSAGTGFHLNITHPATDSDTIGQFGAKTYQIAGSFIYKGNQESKLYIPTADNTFTTASGDYVDVDVNASPAYDERIMGARVYIRPDGTNEPWSLMVDMDLKDGCRTGMDDEYKAWAVGSDATEAGVDTLILTSENLETYTILNGFNPDEFSITLSEFGEGYVDAIIANRRVFACNVTMVDENADSFTDATCDYNNDPTITMDSTVNIRTGMSVSGTGIPTGAYVASVTNITTFELSASTTGGSVTNGTLTFSNIMKKMRDRIMYTPPNKYETFPRSFFIDVVKGDADEYTALATYGDRLFAFKKNTLYIINIGSPSPANWFLESTERNKGVRSKGAVGYNKDGVYWVNAFGCFYFNGGQIVNLIKEKIPQSTWVEKVSRSNARHSQITYHEKTNSIYILNNNLNHAPSGDTDGVYNYNFDSKAWVWQRQHPTSDVDKFYSNFIPDGSGNVQFSDANSVSGTTTVSRAISDTAGGDAVLATKWIMQTKDIDFGDPARIKKVYGVRVSYQSSAAQTTPIAYAIDGIANFSGAGGGNFTGNFADTSGVWDILYAYVASPVECQSMQIQVSNPTSNGTIKINDISIEYRTINKRVT